MKPHEPHVVDKCKELINEHKEVNEKINKLDTFINSPTYAALKSIEQNYLNHQIDIMEQYSNILALRISNFKTNDTLFYIGIKIIHAFKQEKDGKEGYSVTYQDGHIGWSPKDTFEASYSVIEGYSQNLTYSEALHLLKLGHTLKRRSWGKDVYIRLIGKTIAISAFGGFSDWVITNENHIENQLAEDWMVVD
jgi:hypothetical protein